MSKESLDYQKLCSNYYSSWEEGCCMESCEFYNHNECPVVYVNGLIADLEAKLALTEKALELACDNLREHGDYCCYCKYNYCKYNFSGIGDKCPEKCPDIKKEILNDFKTKAKEIMKSE